MLGLQHHIARAVAIIWPSYGAWIIGNQTHMATCEVAVAKHHRKCEMPAAPAGSATGLACWRRGLACHGLLRQVQGAKCMSSLEAAALDPAKVASIDCSQVTVVGAPQGDPSTTVNFKPETLGRSHIPCLGTYRAVVLRAHVLPIFTAERHKTIHMGDHGKDFPD